MKKSLVLVLMCITCIAYTTAQSRISSVYGVNLGDSESTVSSKVTGTWKTNSKGERYLSVRRPTLGSVTFDSGSFWFANGKLSIVNFSSFDGGMMDANFTDYTGMPSAYDAFLAKQDSFRSKFSLMRADLMGKYGPPIVDDENTVIWKSNGNQIKLQYIFEDNPTGYGGGHDCQIQVLVQYKSGGTSSNF